MPTQNAAQLPHDCTTTAAIGGSRGPLTSSLLQSQVLDDAACSLSRQLGVPVRAAPALDALPSTATHGAIAAAVVRKSKKDEEGIRAQLTKCEQAAQGEGAVIPRTESFRFIDDATSGVETERDGLARLYDLFNSGERPPFTVLYVKDRSRLARADDPRWIFWFEVQCLRYGVLVRYTDEEPPKLGPDGKPLPPREQFLLYAVKNFFTSEERRATIRKTRGGRRSRVRRGFWPGGSAPYGTVRYLAHLGTGELVEPVPVDHTIRRDGHGYKLVWATDGTLETVTRIFEWLDAGWSLRRCARQLNADRVPSPGARLRARSHGATPSRWTSEAVREIAKQPLYKGELWYGRTTVTTAPMLSVLTATEDDAGALCHPMFMPNPPIAADLWDRVNAWLRRAPVGGPGRHSDRYLLSGIPSCRHCGERLVGQRAVPKSRRASPVEYRYYWHRPADRERGPEQRCMYAGRVARADILEAHAQAALQTIIQEAPVAARIQDECRSVLTTSIGASIRAEERAARAELTTASKASDLARKRYLAIESDSVAKDALADYEATCARRADAEARLDAILRRGSSVREAKALFDRHGLRRLADAGALLAAASRAEKRQLFRTLIHSLVVDFGEAHAKLSLFALH